MIKGKVSAYAAPIQEYFSPFHVSLSVSQKSDMSMSIINDKVYIIYNNYLINMLYCNSRN